MRRAPHAFRTASALHCSFTLFRKAPSAFQPSPKRSSARRRKRRLGLSNKGAWGWVTIVSEQSTALMPEYRSASRARRERLVYRHALQGSLGKEALRALGVAHTNEESVRAHTLDRHRRLAHQRLRARRARTHAARP